MRYYLLFIVCLFSLAQSPAQTQQGIVKTRGRMVNGQHVAGKGLQGATIQIEGRSAILSGTKGKFSFPLTTNTYLVQSVKKIGYQLVDADAMKKPFQYSSNPLCIVMEKPEQQMEDLLEAEEKISNTLRQQIKKARQEIQRLKDKQIISEAEYGQRIAKLMQNQENNQKLIAEMAREYAQMDYDQMDELNCRISDAIINGRLIEADSLLRSKGDMNSRVAEVKKALQAEARQEKELARQQSELTASKAGTQKKLEDIAADCYKFFNRFKMENLHDSAAHYILLRAELAENAQWQFDAANYLLEQNQYPQSEKLFVKALNNYRCLAETGLQNYDSDIATTLSGLAIIYMNTQRYAESDSLFRKAINIYRDLVAINPKVNENLGTTLINCATLYRDAQRFDDSEAMSKEALGIFRHLATESSQAYEKDVSLAIVSLADLYASTQRSEESEKLYLENLEILRRLSISNPQVYEPNISSTLNNLALLYDNTQQFDKAETMYHESLEIIRRLAKTNPLAYEPKMARIENNVAIIYSKTKRFSEAEKMFLEVLAIRRQLMKVYPTVYEADLAVALANLANLYKSSGRKSEAEPLYQEALVIRQKLATDNPQIYEPALATLLFNLASLHGETKQYDAAEKEFEQVLSIRRRLAKTNPQVYNTAVSKTLESFADLYIMKTDFSKAEEYAKESTLLTSTQLTSFSILAAAQLFQGKYAEAKKLYRQFKDIIKDTFLEDLQVYDEAGVIPKKRESDVKRIKKMLTE